MKTKKSNPNPIPTNLGQWTISFDVIRFNKKISPIAKLTFEEIYKLSIKTGYCYADYPYFCQCFGYSLRTYRRCIQQLKSIYVIYHQDNHIFINYEALELLFIKYQRIVSDKSGTSKVTKVALYASDKSGTYNKSINKSKKINLKKTKATGVEADEFLNEEHIKTFNELSSDTFVTPYAQPEAANAKMIDLFIKDYKPLYMKKRLGIAEENYIREKAPELIEEWEAEFHESNL